MTMDFLYEPFLGFFKAETLCFKFLAGSHPRYSRIGFPTLIRHCRFIGQALFGRLQVFVFLMDYHSLFLLLVSCHKSTHLFPNPTYHKEEIFPFSPVCNNMPKNASSHHPHHSAFTFRRSSAAFTWAMRWLYAVFVSSMMAFSWVTKRAVSSVGVTTLIQNATVLR